MLIFIASQLTRFTASNRVITYRPDFTAYFSGPSWVNSVQPLVAVDPAAPSQISITCNALIVGWPTVISPAGCLAIGLPPIPSICTEVFLGNHYAKFIGVKGALLLQTVTSLRGV